MADLYYGNGECTVQGDIQGIKINYSGAATITKTCGDDCIFVARNNSIVIVSLNDDFLNNLFTYVGNIKIKSVTSSDSDAKKIRCYIRRVMDYSELLDTNAEDMNTKSEDLKAGYGYTKSIKKTSVVDNIMKNQHTGTHNIKLYLDDGSLYNGYFHIHEFGRIMTGGEHTKDSRQLHYERKNIQQFRKGKRR